MYFRFYTLITMLFLTGCVTTEDVRKANTNLGEVHLFNADEEKVEEAARDAIDSMDGWSIKEDEDLDDKTHLIIAVGPRHTQNRERMRIIVEPLPGKRAGIRLYSLSEDGVYSIAGHEELLKFMRDRLGN